MEKNIGIWKHAGKVRKKKKIRSAGVLHMTQNDASGFLGLFVSNHSMNRSRLGRLGMHTTQEFQKNMPVFIQMAFLFFLTKRRHRPAPMLISLSQNSSTYSQTHHHPKVSFFSSSSIPHSFTTLFAGVVLLKDEGYAFSNRLNCEEGT